MRYSRFPPQQVLKGCQKKWQIKKTQKVKAKGVCYESFVFLANHWIQVFQIQKKAKKERKE